MSCLHERFPEYLNLINIYKEQDPDFQKLCTDYEMIFNSIKELKKLVDISQEKICRQISEKEELLVELEKDIIIFLENEREAGLI